MTDIANILINMQQEIDRLRKDLDRLEAEPLSTKINIGEVKELTIAVGVVAMTQSYHTVDTEADAGTDDLDTINGGSIGDILFIRAASTDRTVVVKDTTGNLLLEGDCSLDYGGDFIVLLRTDATFWCELSRSNNG